MRYFLAGDLIGFWIFVFGWYFGFVIFLLVCWVLDFVYGLGCWFVCIWWHRFFVFVLILKLVFSFEEGSDWIWLFDWAWVCVYCLWLSVWVWNFAVYLVLTWGFIDLTLGVRCWCVFELVGAAVWVYSLNLGCFWVLRVLYGCYGCSCFVLFTFSSLVTYRCGVVSLLFGLLVLGVVFAWLYFGVY